MAMSYVPEGYGTVTPYLVVRDARRLMRFLQEAFDAKETERMDNADGTIAHAAVRLGDSMVMLGQATSDVEPRAAMICLYVPDADKAYAQALAAGATSVREMATQFYGDRTGGVRDPTGNEWWLSTHVEDVSDEELQRRYEALKKGTGVSAQE